jgi:uncharacterized alpha-E superfamily protein
MPGGLARIAPDNAADVVSAQRGGGAKDVWVLTGGAAEDSATTADGPWTSVERRNDIPARLVENLYWLGRYSERCENKVRLIRGAMSARTDSGLRAVAEGLCVALHAVSGTPSLPWALHDPSDPVGPAADVKRLAFSASQVRNRLSTRYWRGIVGLQRQLQEAAPSRGSTLELCERLLQSLAALGGFSEVDMMRDEGWQAMQLGRSIERAQFIAAILQQQLRGDGPVRPDELEWMLEVCQSLQEYRSRYPGPAHLRAALALLLADARHPMSLAFQSLTIDRLLKSLSRTTTIREEWGLGAVPLPDGDVAHDGVRRAIEAQLATLVKSALELSDRFTARFFVHVEVDAHLLTS